MNDYSGLMFLFSRKELARNWSQIVTGSGLAILASNKDQALN
jgi:hypothetical protein